MTLIISRIILTVLIAYALYAIWTNDVDLVKWTKNKIVNTLPINNSDATVAPSDDRVNGVKEPIVEQNKTLNFHLIETAQELIKEIEVKLLIREAKIRSDSSIKSIEGPLCNIRLSDEENKKVINFESSGTQHIARVSSGEDGYELRVNFKPTHGEQILGQEVASLSAFSTFNIDISPLYRSLGLSLQNQESCMMTTILNVNGVDVALLRGSVRHCSDLGKSSMAVTNNIELPNSPFQYSVIREELFNGPILYSTLITKTSEYSSALKAVGELATQYKNSLMPSPVAVSIFDHGTGQRSNYSQTTLDDAVTIIKGYAVSGKVPVSFIIGGAGAIKISGPVSFETKIK